MALTSRKRDKLFMTYKEATAGTADTNGMIESRGTMDFPEPEYQHESDYAKLGSGEHGRRAELQAVWTPFSWKPQRFSEVAYGLAYFQGKGDEVHTITSGVYMHDLHHMPVSQRTLPTFGFQYGPGSAAANMVMAGCTINEFSLGFAVGGNGVVDATFGGAGNRHRIDVGDIAENAAGSLSAGEVTISTEPLLNFKCCHLWAGSGLETTPGPTSLSTTGYDLADAVNITTLLSSMTITGNNGMAAENQARASGCGLINDFSRGDRRYTIELGLRKDAAVWDINSFIVGDTIKALELQFVGPFINGTHRYSLHLLFPALQILRAPENSESPIGRTLTTEVFENASGDSMVAYAQSAVSVGYNATKA